MVQGRMQAIVQSQTDVTESVDNEHTFIINVWENYCFDTEACNCDTPDCRTATYHASYKKCFDCTNNAAALNI